MTLLMFSGSILIVVIRGAYLLISLRGSAIVLSHLAEDEPPALTAWCSARDDLVVIPRS